jgi:hypothetical protein
MWSSDKQVTREVATHLELLVLQNQDISLGSSYLDAICRSGHYSFFKFFLLNLDNDIVEILVLKIGWLNTILLNFLFATNLLKVPT